MANSNATCRAFEQINEYHPYYYLYKALICIQCYSVFIIYSQSHEIKRNIYQTLHELEILYFHM